MKLNLGCGQNPLSGYINIDNRIGVGVDIVRDLNEQDCLHRIETGTVDAIRANALFEHLLTWENCMMECARVLRVGGTLEIRVPNGIDAAAWHMRIFTPISLDFFREDATIRMLDMRKRSLSFATSCEVRGIAFFRTRIFRKEHHYPFSWHLAKRFGDGAYRIPLGRTKTLYWLLERNTRVYRSV